MGRGEEAGEALAAAVAAPAAAGEAITSVAEGDAAGEAVALAVAATVAAGLTEALASAVCAKAKGAKAAKESAATKNTENNFAKPFIPTSPQVLPQRYFLNILSRAGGGKALGSLLFAGKALGPPLDEKQG